MLSLNFEVQEMNDFNEEDFHCMRMQDKQRRLTLGLESYLFVI